MKTNLKVILLEHTPEPEKLIAASAKLCYSKLSGDEIMNDLDNDSTEKFLNILIDLGHESPIEHVSFTFAIEGVSRTLTHQLVRHRIASYSQRSQRYVNEEGFDFIVPPEIENNYEAKEIYYKHMVQSQKNYSELTEILKNKHYNKLLAEGLSEKKAESDAEKKSNEDARYILPNSCETKIIVTMNARALVHFFNVRCCERAQWEIRELATQMLIQVKKVAPIIFKNAGPLCIKDKCPEGKMSCGKQNKMKEKFLK